MSEYNTEIRKAIDSFDVEQARALLRDALKQNADAETYYLASQVALNDSQKKSFLEKALGLDPFHRRASEDLELLKNPHKQTGQKVTEAVSNQVVTAPPVSGYSQIAPTTESKSLPLYWYLIWAVVTVGGAVAGWEISFIISKGSNDLPSWISWAAGGLTGGLIVAAGQWFVLNTVIEKNNFWFPITLVAWLVAQVQLFLNPAKLSQELGLSILFGIAGLIIGIAQWLNLRLWFRNTGLWVLGNVVGLVITFNLAWSLYRGTLDAPAVLYNIIGCLALVIITTPLLYWYITKNRIEQV
jgi:hypothetical protein